MQPTVSRPLRTRRRLRRVLYTAPICLFFPRRLPEEVLFEGSPASEQSSSGSEGSVRSRRVSSAHGSLPHWISFDGGQRLSATTFSYSQPEATTQRKQTRWPPRFRIRVSTFEPAVRLRRCRETKSLDDDACHVRQVVSHPGRLSKLRQKYIQ